MTSRRLRMLLIAGALAVAGSIGLPAAAFASFKSTMTASTSISSATFAAPTYISDSVNCGTDNVLVTWPATTSTYATGYTVLYSKNGGAATVAGSSTTTSYTMRVNGSSSYRIEVEATYLFWTSPATAWTPSFNC